MTDNDLYTKAYTTLDAEAANREARVAAAQAEQDAADKAAAKAATRAAAKADKAEATTEVVPSGDAA